MARSRVAFGTMLKGFSDKTYYQPPSNIVLTYPCIIYHRDVDDIDFANDSVYKQKNLYRVTLIEKDPDSSVSDNMLRNIPYTRVLNRFTVDKLYHTVFEIYY